MIWLPSISTGLVTPSFYIRTTPMRLEFMYQPLGNLGYIYLRILAAEKAMLSKAEEVRCIDRSYLTHKYFLDGERKK